MTIHLICIGTLKERYWSEAAEEYRKRISKYCALKTDELKEERAPNNASPAEETAVKDAEGRCILRRVKADSYVVALDMRGETLSSEAFARKLSALPHAGKNHIVFIVGGPLGLADAVLRRADLCLSLSKMTYPHRMARIVLLEQLYRSFKIIGNEAYHK
ncbi:MAG: 23S rRNA (pseudouridine(1915)-N(3))-methyltransferase RlmH [Clostridiales Family XIII bacterium]|jgi:23S rRNA (pseudouridine1915-N3)-methyltransferase|nr:23S rRNA (pseudouridine(1915)-N(3))-methyltransferase RlmH [Clostridiales Family XIII bacterium]